MVIGRAILTPFRASDKADIVLGDQPHGFVFFHRHDSVDTEIAHSGQLRNYHPEIHSVISLMASMGFPI